ncbi:MAG TPA: hypothetical protein VG826_25860 [Pirellulales bacterium]|nr:hypothetical protein [Pirellulales bacterium]
MPLAWTNDATWIAQRHLSAYRYSELMMASRRIWGDAERSENRSAVALERLAAFVREMATSDKLAGRLVGIDLDDIDLVQIADYWLGGIAAYHELARA